jgi:hypothetical protein
VWATIVGNHLRDARLNAVNLVDMGNSRILVKDNFISADTSGMAIFRGVNPPRVPSTIIVEHNRFEITDRSSEFFGFPGDGLFFVDFTLDGGIDRVFIRHNEISLGVPAFFGFFDGIFVHGDRGHVRIVENKLSGLVLDAGIVIDNSVGTRTRNNDFSGLEPGPPDVLLTETTSECRVREPGATVVDLGTNNIVHTELSDDLPGAQTSLGGENELFWLSFHPRKRLATASAYAAHCVPFSGRVLPRVQMGCPTIARPKHEKVQGVLGPTAAKPTGAVTIETSVDFFPRPVHGTFEVVAGSALLGCAAGTFVDEPAGGFGISIRKTFTCTQGGQGSFTFNFTPVIFVSPGVFRGHWNVLATKSTDDFVGLRGEGDFSVVTTGSVEDETLEGQETLTGTIRFVP